MADVQILDKDWGVKSKPLFWLDKDQVVKSKPLFWLVQILIRIQTHVLACTDLDKDSNPCFGLYRFLILDKDSNPCFSLYRFLIRIGLLKVNRIDRFGREKNQTEINRFEPVFGSVQKLKKKIGLVVYFGPKLNRTENAQPYTHFLFIPYLLH